jgi:hypothetical protein
MKKLTILIALFSLIACTQKTPQQKADEEFRKVKANRMQHELYIDSLVNVAYGMGNFKYLTENRLAAIKILKTEYPNLSQKFDSLEMAIRLGNY